MKKWCPTCQKHIADPGTSETTKYAKFWRDSKCSYCDSELEPASASTRPIDVDAFLSEIRDRTLLRDGLDAVGPNYPGLAEANEMAADPQRREEGISRLSELLKRFPTSGHVCALYAQALAWDGREHESIAFVRKRFFQVARKSDLASVAGIVSLRQGKLDEAIVWFLRSAAARRGSETDEHLLLELSSIFEAVGRLHQDDTLVAVASRLQELVGGRVIRSTRDDLAGLAAGVDPAVLTLLRAAAELLGWARKRKRRTRETRKWWQFWK